MSNSNNSSKAYLENIIGPDYDYTSYIRSPDELKVSTKGSISQIKTNYKAMGEYFKLIVSGDSKASKEGAGYEYAKGQGRILGPAFFIDTFSKCKDPTGKKQPRSIYYSFKPTGDIVIANGGSGMRGLFPGILSNLDILNPEKIMSSISQGSEPDCQLINMPVVPTESNNGAITETKYVSNDDISNIDPCAFANSLNPVSKARCSTRPWGIGKTEGFDNIYTLPKDFLVELYIGSISILLLLLLLNICKKYN